MNNIKNFRFVNECFPYFDSDHEELSDEKHACIDQIITKNLSSAPSLENLYLPPIDCDKAYEDLTNTSTTEFYSVRFLEGQETIHDPFTSNSLPEENFIPTVTDHADTVEDTIKRETKKNEAKEHDKHLYVKRK